MTHLAQRYRADWRPRIKERPMSSHVRRVRVLTALALAASLLVFLHVDAARAAWPDPVRVSNDVVGLAAVGVADDGTTTVMWSVASGSDLGLVIRLARISPAGNVGAPIEVAHTDDHFTMNDPHLGVSPDGTAVVAWSDYRHNPSPVSAVRVSPDNHVGPVQVIASPWHYGIPPTGMQVVVDSADTATVVWARDLTDGSTSIVEAVRISASGAAEPVQTLGSGDGSLSPSVAALPNRRVLVAWSAARAQPPQTTTISASGIEGAIKNLDSAPGGSTAIAVSADGQAAVTWLQGDSRTLHARRIASNAALGPDVQLAAPDELGIAAYRIALTNTGVLTALWTTGGYQDLIIAHALPNGSVVGPTTVGTAPPDYCPIGPEFPLGPPSPSVCVVAIALNVDHENNVQAMWFGADNRMHARRIPFSAPAEPYDSLPGIDVFDIQQSELAYLQSEDRGYELLLKHLKAQPTRFCFVLVGYSEGAHVVGDVLEIGLPTAVRRRIVATALLADPAFDPKDTTVEEFGTFKSQYHGYFAARTRGAMAKNGIRVFSACHKGDFFCQFGADVINGPAIHSDYTSWATNLAHRAAGLVQHRFAAR